MNPRGFRWVRLVLLLSVVGVLALAFLPFEVGEQDASPRTCYAALDGWASGPPRPSNTDLAIVEQHVATSFPQPGMSKAEIQKYAEQERAWMKTPAWTRVERYGAWAEEGGACVLHGARDRLVTTGWLAGATLLGGAALVVWRRRARALRHAAVPQSGEHPAVENRQCADHGEDQCNTSEEHALQSPPL